MSINAKVDFLMQQKNLMAVTIGHMMHLILQVIFQILSAMVFLFHQQTN